MSYFRELPNVEFENFLENSTGSQDYILLKNIFIRGKLRDDLQMYSPSSTNMRLKMMRDQTKLLMSYMVTHF